MPTEAEPIVRSENKRAQLWAVYFGLRALEQPPAFLHRAESELRRFLESGDVPQSAKGLPAGHLHLVE